MKLNAHQIAAVNYVAGPCLVLAGAGSGKTRVITQKIAYLIQQCQYKPSSITALTFTNKAAREMKTRALTTLGSKDAKGLWVSTFHTLGLEIIRREHHHFDLKKNFSLFDAQDSLALLKELAESLNIDKEALQNTQHAISNWKTKLIKPEQALREARDDSEQVSAKLYATYVSHMKSFNALDFDDLILLPTLLFQNNTTVLARWQNKIRYLLVDEYQDTNTSQYTFIRLLVGERARFTVVGDDDQSIYSWRGARPENLLLLQQDYPTLEVVKLEQNYRSSLRILRSANKLIDHNPHVFPKKLFSELGLGEPLRIVVAKNEEHVAQRVISEILRHKFMNRTSFGEYAILYRSNHQARLFEQALMGKKIPYKISGGMSFFDRSEVKDVMAYLRLLVNHDDDNAFLRIINLPKRGIGPATLAKLGELASQWKQSLFETCLDRRTAHVLSGAALYTLQAFARLFVETLDQSERGEPLEAFRSLMKSIQYEQFLNDTSASPKAAQMRLKNIAELYRWLTQMIEGEYDEPMSLTQAINRLILRDMLERQSDEQISEQVQMMTLHSAKGLEFPYVFMVGMEEGLLPHQNSIDSDDIEEERRLAYVGITRAKVELCFTLCQARRQFGDMQAMQPSRFLNELPEKDIYWEGQTKEKSAEDSQQSGRQNVANLRKMLMK